MAYTRRRPDYMNALIKYMASILRSYLAGLMLAMEHSMA